MTNYNFLFSLNLSKDVIAALSSNLDRVVKGNSDVLTSPYLSTSSSYDILMQWDSIFDANRSIINNSLYMLEQNNRSKFGPRSIAIPWVDRSDAVGSFFTPETPTKILRTVSKARRSLRPKSLQESIKLLKNNTNSGLPYYRRKGLVKEQTLQNFQTLLDEKFPCVMFTRTQEEKKTRTVWGYPIADTLNEMRFYAPLLEYQKKLNWRNSLVSPDAVNNKMTNLINLAGGGRKLLSIDFSSYDSTLKYSLQKAAFNYIIELFQPSYETELQYIFERFNTIGLITPDGIFSGSHGVPSGSTFTNEVDSIAQYIISTNFGLSSDYFDIQGDDGAYCVTDPEDLMEYFKLQGLNVNGEKSKITDDYLLYLQNLYHKDYVGADGIIGGIYPTYRALNRILYLERFTDFEGEISGKDYFSIRTICILENCKYHPLFKELVEFVYSLDKYKLEFSQQGLSSYIKRVKQSSGVAGVFNFRYEDSISNGIQNFETFKYLKTLSA